ncbi:GNAT family N-acetyltransferase [Labrenzia sp. PHM005]|uniref:GNAT family N-acetyltransferase n=1 Tax=Labrenzia sp. PHM005 TaxID=2590016 RepID=UPI0011400A76|nr:GNAT family N-acetyltransferase [Labrenzia sp. PHM005]QDG78585.1 GNAT family N-acetyltransferase [Labrenzia sp. PHM005]
MTVFDVSSRTPAASSFVPERPVHLLSAEEADAAVPDLAKLLKDCVEDGAGIGFVLPLTLEKAEAFWRERAADVAGGTAFMLVAKDGAEIAGVVMLCLAPQDNGRHRADVAKLMVHPDHRRKGLARKLMTAIDGLALSLGRWLLVLDTVTGDRAEKLYPTCGYIKVGVIPDYAYGSHEGFDDTTVFYKDLREIIPK